MEITSYKCYNEKAEIEFDPNALIKDQFGKTDSVLKYLIEYKPELITNYILHLKKRIKNAIDTFDKKDGFYDFPDIEEKFEFLDQYPELRKLTQEFLLVHMNPLKKSPKNSEKFIVYGLNQAMALERISYHRVKTFVELLGKENGIELYTKILTKIVDDMHTKNQQKSDISMTKNHEKAIKYWCKRGLADFAYCRLDEHMTIYRFDSCFTHTALKDFNDPDIAYYASCYIGDIPEYNKKRIIHLRRTQTLHHKDFCDELYWDSRVHNNPKHPSIDFIRNLEKD